MLSFTTCCFVAVLLLMAMYGCLHKAICFKCDVRHGIVKHLDSKESWMSPGMIPMLGLFALSAAFLAGVQACQLDVLTRKDDAPQRVQHTSPPRPFSPLFPFRVD